jgi:outer membrane protein, heavy metal efflux system
VKVLPLSHRLAALVWLVFAAAAHAGEAPDALVALSLDDAAALAVQHQPHLEAFDAEARAARQRAIAAGQLPDPTLNVGVSDLTLEGRDRFTLQNESDTQFMAGVRQAFPRAEKLRLRRERGEEEAATFDAERSAAERMIARETGLAWLEVWKAEQSLSLTNASLVEAERQVKAATIALSANRATQAEVLAARVDADALRDRADGYRQSALHYRNNLARWVGEAAFNPLCPDLPAEAKPDAPALIAALATHPHLLAEAKKIAVTETDVKLAKQDYRPDWAVSLGYGYRPAFADYASVQVEIPLPIFSANRQDKQLESAHAMQAAQESRLADTLREQTALIRLNSEDWSLLQERLARFDSSLLPQSKARIAAALSSYGAGSGTLKDVLDARRMALELAMQKLDLQLDSAKHQVQLRYFAP